MPDLESALRVKLEKLRKNHDDLLQQHASMKKKFKGDNAALRKKLTTEIRRSEQNLKRMRQDVSSANERARSYKNLSQEQGKTIAELRRRIEELEKLLYRKARKEGVAP